MKTIDNNNKSLINRISILCFLLIGCTSVYAQDNKGGSEHVSIDPAYTPPPPDSIAIHLHADTMPKFPGDMIKYIQDSIRYPEGTKEKKIQGAVYISLIIERDGSVSNVSVLRSPDSSLSIEAKRVVSTMPKWVPGKQKGKTVRVNYTIAVRFNLPADSSDSTMKK